MVGAVAEHESAQHRVAARLRDREPGDRRRARHRAWCSASSERSDHGPVIAVFDVGPIRTRSGAYTSSTTDQALARSSPTAR